MWSQPTSSLAQRSPTRGKERGKHFKCVHAHGAASTHVMQMGQCPAPFLHGAAPHFHATCCGIPFLHLMHGTPFLHPTTQRCPIFMPRSTSASCFCAPQPWCLHECVCMHWPACPATRWPVGHSPLPGHGLQIRDSCFSRYWPSYTLNSSQKPWMSECIGVV